MGIRLHHLLLTAGLALVFQPTGEAGKYGFADKEGGSKNDPVIKVYASVGPNAGALFSYTPEQANSYYVYDGATTINLGTNTPPTLPTPGGPANQFIQIKFPMQIHKKGIRKTLMKNKASLAATSYLTSNITIEDDTQTHVTGIAVINGKTALGVKVKKNVDFPTWLDSKGKNRLLDKSSLVYIADTGDQDLSTIASFDNVAGSEVRVRVHEVGGVIVNGYWVLKIGGGGVPAVPGILLIDSVTPTQPVTPAKTKNGLSVVETFSSYVIRYSEPVVPQSVGFYSNDVVEYNATNPVVPLYYNGNTSIVPNPKNLQVPYFPNMLLTGSPNGVLAFQIPFDVVPMTPNNLSEYKIKPLLDLPGKITFTLTGLDFSNTLVGPWPTSIPGGPATYQSAATSLYNVPFDDATPTGSFSFWLTGGGRAFTNVPVAPQAMYYLPLSGGGVGALNLNGQGYETNDPSTEKLLIFTNATIIGTCPFGSFMFGCNNNVFGDPSAANPIGLGGNPVALKGPTPLPGVNEGSIDSTANGTNPLSVYPTGFETVCRNSEGDARLAKTPIVGSAGDIQVGDFLDKLFYDTGNPWAGLAYHQSLVIGTQLVSNTLSDPPLQNPPPLRLPVGLPPVDIVFTQQNFKKPAYVIEGEEIFYVGLTHNIMLIPNTSNPLAGDTFPTFPHNGPLPQTFTAAPNLPFAARQQIGNFLYVTDRDQGVVQCLNSNTFTVVDTLNTPDPEGLGLAPDLRSLFVSNFGDDTVSIIGTDPYSPFWHKEVNRVKVGAGPRDVACQPDGEDVLIANFLGNSVSVLEPKIQAIRKTVSAGVSKPWELVVTPRYQTTGWQAGVYVAFIANQGTGDILVFESGPSGSTGFGMDDIRWSADLAAPFSDMRGLCYDPNTYPGASTYLPGGVYVTHRDANTGLAMVSRVCWTSQLPGAGAYPPVPLPSSPLNAPGIIQRKFEVVGTWGGPLVPISQQINFGGQDQMPYDVAMLDFSAKDFYSVIPAAAQTNGAANPATPAAAAGGLNSKHPHRVVMGFIVPTVTPDRMYVSFPGDNKVEVLDPNLSGTRLNSVVNVAVPGRLAGYFDQ